MRSDDVYARMWEFTCKPGAGVEFENLYGPDGEWVQLFRRSKAFLGTEVFHDHKTENHYVTIDYFASKTAFDNFLREFLQEYEALDRRCHQICEAEREVGAFTPLSASPSRTSS